MTEEELKAHGYKFVVQHHKKVISVTVQARRRLWESPHVATCTEATRAAAMEAALEKALVHFVEQRLALNQGTT